MRALIVPVFIAIALAGNTKPACGSNERGHKVVAYIAYRQLDAATRSKVADLLRRHPELGDWQARSDGGPNADLNLFLFAAVFADEAHRWHAFDEPRSHYAGFPYVPRPEDQQDPLIRRVISPGRRIAVAVRRQPVERNSFRSAIRK
ncbi:MAG: hypothetical protein HY000_30670 [Planctomycetes bacterium]|nr:hypothetical protein [Planctomycetota bacterium]